MVLASWTTRAESLWLWKRWNQPGACKEVDLPTAITTVNQMLCETQNYRIPSDDPVKDCQKEDEISKPLPKEE